ncbi:ATP synthase subunit C lysine N-methyltransferase-like [Amphiura filiformis]|uniref:ATP synthase subunit C lysine N-methyltransferase-like n=1 Tax=Amphiura filiformis TaxID=82378 RepID=UPI003B228432
MKQFVSVPFEEMSLSRSDTSKAGKAEKPPWYRRPGLIATGAVFAVVGGVYVVAMPFVTPAFRRICLPFVPATDQQVKNVFKLLQGRKGSLVDLGSGDGRLVFEAAKQGFHSTGYELNLWLVWYSKMAARRRGLHKMASFYRRDLWKTDLSNYDQVVIFGVTQMMEPLKDKLSNELKVGGQVVACRFPFTDLTPIAAIEEGIDSAWLYDRTSFQPAEKHSKS